MALTQLTKVDGGGISTTSDYRVGVITASKFVGPFDGSAGNFSGIITATGANFSGNVSIGGTLTYEDVTNIDSVGIITTQQGIHVGAGVSAVGVGTFGGLDINGDLDVDGHTNLDNVNVSGATTTTGVFVINAGTQSTNKTTGALRVAGGAGIQKNVNVGGDLDVDGHTNLDNLSIVGVTTITGTLLDLNSNSANPAIFKLRTNVNTCEIEGRVSGGENHLVLSSNNSTDHLKITGSAVQLPNDDQRLEIGANQELKIAQDGTHNVTYMQNVGPLQLQTDDLRLYNYSTNDLYLRAQTNAGVSLYYDFSTYNTAKLVTTATGVTIDGTAVAGALDISGDIDVDGHTNLDHVSIAGVTTFTNSYIDFKPGNGGNAHFRILSTGTGDAGIFFDAANGDISGSDYVFIGQKNNLDFVIDANTNAGNIDFQRAGTTQVRINSSGYMGVGTNNPNNPLTVHGSGNHIFLKDTATDNVFQIRHAAGVAEFNTYGTGGARRDYVFNQYSSEVLRILSSGEIRIPSGSNSASRLTFGGGINIYHDGNMKIENFTGYLKLQSNNQINIDGSPIYFRNSGGTNRWIIDSSGHFIPGTAGAVDIGSASKEIGNVYIADDKKFYAGSDQNISLYHTSSNGINHLVGHPGNMFYHSGTHYFTDAAQSKIQAQFIHNSYCELRHEGNLKFRTSATGIDVTGEVAASQDYPDFRPALDFNFAAEKKLDPRITYFRSGPASFIDKFGLVKIVGDNVPRFDHDPDTGEYKGLLIEESRTNIAPYANDLSQYSGYNFTATANNAVAPDGTTTATKIEHGGSGTSYLDHINNSVNAAGAGSYTYSVWLKAPDDQPDGYYGCQLAVLHSTGGNVEPTVSLNKTWTRYTVTKTFGASDPGKLRVHLVMFRAAPGSTYGGKVIPSYVWAWGAQIEAGAFATSYIPAAGATRGYEAVTLEGTEFSDVFGTEFKEFSLVADYDNTQTDDGTSYGIIDLWGEASTYDDRIEWFKDNASPYHIETRAFGQGNPIFANGNVSASSKAKSQRFATSWSVPDYSNTSSRRFVVSMGGEAVDVVNDSSGTTVPQITRMGIGCNPTRLDFSPGLLHFKRLMVYNKTLSDGQLQNLSAQ